MSGANGSGEVPSPDLVPAIAPGAKGAVEPRKKHAGGRPTRLTTEVRTRILRALDSGVSIDTAAQFAGVSLVTIRDWLYRGRNAKGGGYTSFLRAVEQRMATFEVALAAVISKAVQEGSWQAALAMLERRRSAAWARTERTEVSGPAGGPQEHQVQIVIVREPAQDWRARVAQQSEGVIDVEAEVKRVAGGNGA